MQKNEDELFYEELKTDLEIKFGRKLKYSKDCKFLSTQIFEATNRQLSESTIKRFFGLIKTTFKPSKFTLDTFSVYLGYDSWNSYLLFKKTPENNSIGDNGQVKLKECFDAVTATSIQSMTAKAGYDPQRFIHRVYAEERVMEFISSDKTATVLVGPKGYGKTSILLQLYNELLSGKNTKFSDTIVCIIDGEIFFSMYNQPQYNIILGPLIEFDVKAVQNFFQNPEEEYKNNKYIVIIDDADKIYHGKEKYYQLMGNIMQLIMINYRNPGFKIILTCAPESINTITSFLLYNPVLAESFYDVKYRYRNQYEAINVPAFRQNEIREVLIRNLGISSFFTLSLYYPEVFDVIKIPTFLSYFIKKVDIYDDDFSDIRFLNKSVRHFLFSQPFSEEKQLVIKKFLQQCNIEEEFPSVEKDILLNDDNLRVAYQELLNTGMIQEFTLPSETPDTKWKLRFTNSIIFEYLLARYLTNSISLNAEFLNNIFTTYKNSISVQYSLLKWIIKLSFQERNIDLLRQVHQVMERIVSIRNETAGDSMPGTLRIIQNAYIEGLRTHRQSAEILLPWMAASPLGQRLYFEEYFDMDNLMYFPEESIDAYAQAVKTPDARLITCFIKFALGFYSLDNKKCSQEFEKLSQVNYSEIKNPYFQGYYFSVYFMFAYMVKSGGNMDVLEDVIEYSENLKARHPHSSRYSPPFEYFVIYNLNTCDYFEEVLELANHLKSKQEQLKNMSSGFYQLFELCHARALLHTGDNLRAMKLFNKINVGEFPFHTRHFMQLNVNLIVVDFLATQDKTAEALKLLYETKVLATQMDFKFYINKAANYETVLLKARKDIP